MKIKKGLSQLPENAVFWLLLLSLAAGSAASLYGKISDRAALEQVRIEHYTAPPDYTSQSVLSLKYSIFHIPVRFIKFPPESGNACAAVREDIFLSGFPRPVNCSAHVYGRK